MKLAIRKQKFQQLQQEGTDRAMISFWQKSKEKEFYYDPHKMGEAYVKQLERVEALKKIHEQKKEITTSKTCRFAVTVNPDYQNVDFRVFYQKVLKFVQRELVLSGNYTYEVGDTNDNFHVHMNIEIRKRVGISNLTNQLYSTFKYLIGDIKHIVVVPIFDQDGWEAYKSKNYKRTQEFRKSHELLPIYYIAKNASNLKSSKELDLSDIVLSDGQIL